MVSVDVKHHVYLLTEGADRVAGQLRGDKECPFSGVTKSGSLEEGAGKRCSECAFVAVYSYFPLSAQSVGTTEVKEMAPSSKMLHTFKTDTKSHNNNNNVHLSCAHQRPERSNDTY